MKIQQLAEILGQLDKNKRIKFQNREGWKDQTMAVNAILEEGGAYIFIWTAHPHCIKESMNERQKLIWYNPNIGNSKLVKQYFPEYGW
jgi:hypothetical protein